MLKICSFACCVCRARDLVCLLIDSLCAIYEYEFMFNFTLASLVAKGAIIWLSATVALRLGGQWILHPGSGIATVVLFAASALVVALLVRRLCRASKLPREQWPAGAISVLLPTLSFDPFSTAFFPTVFPNIDPAAAGLFGGWMLICCAGGLIGALIRR